MPQTQVGPVVASVLVGEGPHLPHRHVGRLGVVADVTKGVAHIVKAPEPFIDGTGGPLTRSGEKIRGHGCFLCECETDERRLATPPARSLNQMPLVMNRIRVSSG